MIHRSDKSDVDIPGTTLTEHLVDRAHGDRVAVVDAATGERLTYRDLADGVDAAAGGLAALGIGPGDVVALISHNQPGFVLALHAALAAGATVTPVNPALTPGEIAEHLAASRAVAVIASEAVAEKVAGAAVEHRFVIGSATGFTPFGSLTGVAPVIDVDPATTVALLPFSSGTTGPPKGVMLTHRNLVANVEQNSAQWRVTPDEVFSAVLPFFHVYGFSIILGMALRHGCTVVTLPRYEHDAHLRMIAEHRVTRAFLAPPMVLGLANRGGGGHDLSSLRFAVSGAAPLDVAVVQRAEAVLGCPIRQGYGMTEASPGITLVPEDGFTEVPAGSVGTLLPSTEVRLVDPATGEDSEEGELWARGPQVMAGYLDNPEATAATVVEGGWLRTGDVARIDGDFYLIVDRLKELIKYKGYQVAPAELEALLLTHPDVLDVAVVGVPHDEGGEAPKAFVVASTPTDPELLMEWVAARVAPYKKVRDVEFVDAIPKSPSGKILRRLLR
ncbi:AMP-binding protein [Umezawaea endophytica]|uniref:AMP-binding protein n=1 Tax=Umezawaea endophytica TaxID=1654476 RepID=A0A9X2VNP6_9PSEU|nr:AMP-binding protein [Umezawaea endophytica]MCS7479876.1 AMP-binding protein [Umezawaea endophytica]